MTAEYRRGAWLVTGAAVVWSSAGLLARVVATDPWTTLFWRSAYALGFLLTYLVWRDGRGIVRSFRRLGVVGLGMAACFAVSMLCFINALSHTTVAAVLMFQAASPLVAAGLAWLALRETVSGFKLAAIVVSLAGVGIIVSDATDAGSLWGNALSAMMGITYAATVVLSRMRRDVPTTEASCVAVMIVLVVALPSARFTLPPFDMAVLATFGIFQMGLALIMFTTGVRLIPAADAGLISVLECVLGPVLVWLFVGETPGPTTLVGSAVVLAAVVAAVGWDRREETVQT